MKNNLTRSLLVAAILTTCFMQSVVAEQGRVELSGSNAETVNGIKDSHYKGNFGGAVYNTGTNKTLSGEFLNNSSQVSGGAVLNEKGGEITVTAGSSFSGNTIVTTDLPQSFGGAVYNYGSFIVEDGTKESHTIFSNNTAAVGGAIYNTTTGDPLYIGNNTAFINNTATGAIKPGGGITGTGGAIYARSGFTTGDNVLFQGNQSGANSYGGGAISINLTNTASMPDPIALKSVTIGKGAQFINNHTDTTVNGSRGGAILLEAAPDGVTIGEGALFSGNNAQSGGAIYTQAKITIGNGSVFQGNVATNNAYGLISGGAIANWFGTVNIGQDTGFLSNKAKGNGGAIDNFGTVTIGNIVDGVLTADGTGFDGNHSDANGGAINNYNKLEIGNGTSFTNNTAGLSGGAIFNGAISIPQGGSKPNIDLKGDITIGDNVNFGTVTLNDKNEITGVANGNTAVNRGGAIANQGGTVTIGDNSLFAGNKAGGQGGAISNVALNNATSVAKMTIGDGAYFVSNTSGAEGGAISNVNAFGVGTVAMEIGNDAVFLNNKSGTQGGAIHNQRASLKIGNKALFKGNTAVGYGGGAIYSDASVGTSSSVIIGNAAAFINNKTETSHGGAVMNFNAGDGATFAIGSDALFQGNNATKNGGAIANFGGIMTIADGSAFIGNNSGGNGGAIYQNAYEVSTSSITISGGHTNSEGKLIDTVFTENIAAGKGGAIYAAGTVNLDAVNGNILFDKNTAGGVANDIYLASNGVLEITGSKNVISNSGIAGEAGSVIKNTANLVLGGDNSLYKGTYNQTAGTTILNNNKFFGGTSNITGGNLNITGKSEIVKDSIVDIGANGSMNIASGSNTLMNGIIIGTGSIINEGNFTIGGDGSGFTGDYTQKSGTTTIKADGIFFGGNNTIEKGVLALEIGASLGEDITVTDYSVAFNLHGREVVIGNNGIEILGKDGNTHYINGSLNLEDTTIKVDSTSGITSDIYLGSGASLKNDDGSSIIEIGKGGENVTLSLGGGFSNADKTLNVGDGSTISLTPKAVAETDTDKTVLVLDAAITGGSLASIIVDGTVLEKPLDPLDPGVKYDVGTVIINSDNRDFLGSYTQSDGTVIVSKESVFFAGDNVIEGGTLVLIDGAKLSSSVTIDGTAGGDATDLPALAVTGSLGEITQNMITGGNFNYANIADDSINDNIQINQGGLILANESIIKNENLVDGTLTLTSDSGVRYLGFSNGSGVDGNVMLNDGTALSYGDGAYLKSDSTLTMDNAELLFINDKSIINYGVEITGTGSINQNGSGITNISSALSNATVNVVAEDGMLNFVNKDITKLDKVDITDSATVNVVSNSSTIGDVNITGENASMNVFGNSTIGNTVVNKSTLGLFGNTDMGNLSLGSTLNLMANRTINNVNVNNFVLTDDSNITFDANVRNNTIDTINVINGGSFTDNGNQLLITGINLVESPIDRQFAIDTNNLVQVGGSFAGADIALKDGSLILNTEMGKYLLTSSGASGILNGSLTQLNSQMYRGQVATVASYANQLVVNNMLFDHMNILANDLMAQDKNANRFAAANPLFAPYQYSKKDGDLWYKAYGNFERISMTQGLNVGNNAYGSLIGADFPLVELKNGWKLVPTAYVGYNGGHQTFDGVSMYQNGAQLGAMGTAYKGDLITSLLAYGGGYANDMSVKGGFGSGSDTTGNWFAGVASKTAYNFHLPHDLILQPTALVSYNIFGNQNYHSNFGNMSMNSGFLNGVNVAPGVNLIWNKKTFSLYATAQLVFNIMGDVSGKAGNVDLNDVRMRTTYFEYGIGAMKKFKDRFTGYLQVTLRNGYRTGIGFQGGLQWKIGK